MAKLSKEEAVKAIQGIEEPEVIVLTTKEQSELLDNFKKTTIEQELKGRIAKVYDDIDKDFEQITGLKKPDDVKTYKHWPDVAKQLKDQADAAQKELEKVKAGGSPDLKREIEALQKASLEKDAEWRKKIETIQSEVSTRDIKSALDISTRSLKLSNLPKPVVDTFIESAKSKLAATAKMVDGQLIFLDSEGDPRINKETFKPYTAEELMTLELDPIIDKSTTKKGGGTEPPVIKMDKDGKPDIALTIPQTVRSKVELTKFLIEAGMPQNTPEHEVAYNKYSVNLPIK